MKSLVLAFVLCLISNISFSQDLIRFKDGTEVNGKVKEITEEYIVYTKQSQPDGPIRKVSLNSLSHIIYADGSKEIFSLKKPEEKPSKVIVNEPGSINNTGKTVTIKRRGPDLRVHPGERFPGGDWKKDYVYNNGLYLDLLMGYAYSQEYNSGLAQAIPSSYGTFDNALFGVRFGSKFYIGSNKKYRLGLNIAWANLNILVKDGNDPDMLFAPANFGLATAFKFNENSGLELNTSAGLVLTTVMKNGTGIKYGIDCKYRYGNFAFGIDLSRSQAAFSSSRGVVNSASILVGVKF